MLIVAESVSDLAPAWTPEPNRTLVTEWLRSKRSARDITEFWLFLLNPNRPMCTSLDQVTLTDIQDYTLVLEHSNLSSSTQMRKLAAVKIGIPLAHPFTNHIVVFEEVSQ